MHDRPIRLLSGLPSKGYRRLIVRYPYQSDVDYAHAYQRAAQRLASTYQGQPEDDTILIPYLMLYRHAYELQMKVMIRRLAEWQEIYGAHTDGPLSREDLETHLRKKLSHSLAKNFNYLKKLYQGLNPPQAFPRSIESVVNALHEADKGGVAFRYAGTLPESQEDVDFYDLQALLDTEFDLLCVTLDPLEAAYGEMPHPCDIM